MLISKFNFISKSFLKIKHTLLLSPHKVLQTKSVSGHCEDNGWQLTNRIQSGPGVQWDKRMKIFPFTIFINISTLTRLGLFVKLFAYSDK